MKNNLMDGINNRLLSNNKKLVFNYDYYIDACKKIAEDIKSKYDLKNNDIELIGIARGGLPMLVTLSHMLGIRQISIIQTQMSNSDSCHDYGDFRYISDNITNSNKKCILLEDIIYKGITTNGVIDILKTKKNKEVLDVYSLIVDENFKNISIPNNDININYVYEVAADDWVYFFWETDIRNIQ